ncbi:hypothetical protein EV580_6615 [Mycobacterium sp. BK086]|uniref:hypothetical protein n=1 Tax=Mycobacterium sp. BK086 TaxID=2512165 RepID=UPI00105F136D|nr:hypothetical protein [Mycobacterium sp. BK086]TDO06521.1 hypothetical protein EV580_6615 [Mycobacterium sp. BK086]
MDRDPPNSQGASTTSSIGACWPPEAASNNRIRGFFPTAIENAQGVAGFAEQFSEQIEDATRTGVTRVTIRFVGNRDAVMALHDHDIRCEGVLPLHGLPNYGIVYAAWISPDRAVDDETFDRHHQLISATRAPQDPEKHPRSGLKERGYRLHLIPPSTPDGERTSAAPPLYEIFETFGFSPEGVHNLLSDHNNTIAYITDQQGNVASTAVAENGRIQINGIGTLNLYEITEGATVQRLRGNGLYQALTWELVQFIKQTSTEHVHAIYGESNLASKGVVYAARRNSRRFVSEEAHHYEMHHNPSFGILAQNFKVFDGVEERDFNDFALSYYDLGELPYASELS